MISVSNVSMRYGGKILFEDVTTTFSPGRRYGLTGPNGAGKSTFMKLLSGELETLPTGAMLARARLLLGEGYGSRSLDEADDQLELALAESGEDPALRAYLLAKRAANAAAGRVARMRDAEAWALEALHDADRREVERVALYALAWAHAGLGSCADGTTGG